MEDLSLHLLDIMENSLNAQASRIEVCVRQDPTTETLVLEIRDDGKGMDAETLGRAMDPFFTTRTTRQVGLGLSMLAESARATGGSLTVDSAPGEGTRVEATFRSGHIDMRPLGDIPQTLLTMIVGHPEVELRYEHAIGEETFAFDTGEVREDLGSPRALKRIEERIHQGLEGLAERAAARFTSSA